MRNAYRKKKSRYHPILSVMTDFRLSSDRASDAMCCATYLVGHTIYSTVYTARIGPADTRTETVIPHSTAPGAVSAAGVRVRERQARHVDYTYYVVLLYIYTVLHYGRYLTFLYLYCKR